MKRTLCLTAIAGVLAGVAAGFPAPARAAACDQEVGILVFPSRPGTEDGPVSGPVHDSNDSRIALPNNPVDASDPNRPYRPLHQINCVVVRDLESRL